MRFALIYVALGVMWVIYNYCMFSANFPKWRDDFASIFVHLKLGAYGLAGIAVAIVVWPISMFWTVFPDRSGRAGVWMLHFFRRRYIDGQPPAPPVFRGPSLPPIARTHHPALGCSGEHDWGAAECPCFARCEGCGNTVPTKEMKQWVESLDVVPRICSGSDYEGR
jgi:hypothetical protein